MKTRTVLRYTLRRTMANGSIREYVDTFFSKERAEELLEAYRKKGPVEVLKIVSETEEYIPGMF